MPQTPAKAKTWQIVLIVVGLVGCAAGIVWYVVGSGPRVQMRDSLTMVDVGTGEMFPGMKIGPGGATIPGINPKTKNFSLMPVIKREDGKWYIPERYRPSLDNIEGGTAAVASKESGLVNVKE